MVGEIQEVKWKKCEGQDSYVHMLSKGLDSELGEIGHTKGE